MRSIFQTVAFSCVTLSRCQDILFDDLMTQNTSQWTVTSGAVPVNIATYTTGGAAECPNSKQYCWKLNSAATAHTTTPIVTTGYTDVTLNYELLNAQPRGQDACTLSYSVSSAGGPWTEINTYDSAGGDNTLFPETYNGWAADVTDNSNGIYLQIQGISTPECSINDMQITANVIPTTADPTTADPTTANPTTADPTTATPTTAAPTSATSNPTTSEPTTPGATTGTPTSAAPTTGTPTTASPTAPTAPTTVITQSSVAQYYVVDVYRSVDVSMASNDPAQYPSAPSTNHLSNPGGYPYLAFPIRQCSRNGNDIFGSQYISYGCSDDLSSGLAYRCLHGSDATCLAGSSGACSRDFPTRDIVSVTWSATEYGGGKCDEVAVGRGDTQTVNYMQIDYYIGFLGNDSTGCPGEELDAQTNLGYQLTATDRFATNVCVPQDDGTYIAAKCDLNGGDISSYSDASCSGASTPLVEYRSQCSFVYNPTDDPLADFWFRRYKGCFVDGANIIMPTPGPTNEPTRQPTTPYPTTAEPTTTAQPTSLPTSGPTNEPSTPVPTNEPTLEPTTRPTTMIPTEHPSLIPTAPTSTPTAAPQRKTVSETLVEEIRSPTLIRIVIAVVFVLCSLIACYVWCSEKSKRLSILSSEEYRKKRIQHAKRKIQMERMRVQSQSELQSVHRQASGPIASRGVLVPQRSADSGAGGEVV